MRYRLAVFDLDGTVLDTLEDLKNAANHGLSAWGYPERTLDEVRRFVGNGIRKLIERAVPPGTGEAEINKVHESFTEFYKVHCADNTRLYSGIPELLKNLHEAGCLTAVVSNKADYGVKALCSDYFPGLFSIAVGEREGVRKKPAPDSVNAVLKELGVNADEAVYIGDSDVDVMTAANAHLELIAVDWGFRSRECLVNAGAAKIVSSPEDIGKIILGE